MNMREKHFSAALSLAKILLDTREQFARALRDAAIAQLGSSWRVDTGRALSRHALEPHIDDALYAIGRDGPDGLEDNVRNAVDEIVREALEAAKNGRRSRI